MACTTCTRWMVWNESDQNQIFYYTTCSENPASALVGSGQFYSVCGCQEDGYTTSSDDVYVENGGTGFINYQGILLQPCVDEPEPSITPTQFPTRTPNHTPSNTPTNTVTPTVTRTPNATPTPTSIICGSGITTTNNIYYTDCCGNFVSAKPPIGTIVVFNYTQPYNGINKLNVPATTSCPTPTPTITQTQTQTQTPTLTNTPTNSVTPNSTPTPTPTVSVSKVFKLKNDCDVLTLFDMGVDCNTIQSPSGPYSNDGVLSLNVTGGTSPYSFYWSNGQRTRTLFGVPEGSYKVLVVDYYGDYSSTTICNLFAPSQTPTQTITPTPTITPSPVWPNLCFIYVDGPTSYGPIQFTPYGDMNGKPTWFATYQSVSLLIAWSSTNSRWQMSGWSFTAGIPTNTNQTNIPTGNWALAGGPKRPDITVTQGNCPGYIPLSISISKDNATCASPKNCDGSISLYAFNGLPPYSYSIDNGLTYQSSGIFNGLCANNYTVIVQDSNGNTVNGGVVPVGADNNPVNYNISTQLLNNVSYSQGNQVASWKVNITPPLPTGVTMTFQLKVNATQKNNGPGSGTTINNTVVRKNGVTVTAPATTTATQTLLRPNCSPFSTVTTSTTQVYNITMGHGDVVTGTSQSLLVVTSGVTGSNGCITMVEQTILVSTYSAAISGKASCGQAINNPAGQGIVNHQLSSATSTNPISLRTLTGTTSCSGGQTGVFGTTSLQTLYTQASPGFVDNANVYTNSSLNPIYAAPDGIVFRNPNNTNSSVFVTSGGKMLLVGPNGSTC
jgi:hypothetical protein